MNHKLTRDSQIISIRPRGFAVRTILLFIHRYDVFVFDADFFLFDFFGVLVFTAAVFCRLNTFSSSLFSSRATLLSMSQMQQLTLNFDAWSQSHLIDKKILSSITHFNFHFSNQINSISFLIISINRMPALSEQRHVKYIWNAPRKRTISSMLKHRKYCCFPRNVSYVVYILKYMYRCMSVQLQPSH